MTETLITLTLRDRYGIGLKIRTSREYREKWEAYYKSLQSSKDGRFYRTMPFVIFPLDINGHPEVTNHERYLTHSAFR